MTFLLSSRSLYWSCNSKKGSQFRRTPLPIKFSPESMKFSRNFSVARASKFFPLQASRSTIHKDSEFEICPYSRILEVEFRSSVDFCPDFFSSIPLFWDALTLFSWQCQPLSDTDVFQPDHVHHTANPTSDCKSRQFNNMTWFSFPSGIPVPLSSNTWR